MPISPLNDQSELSESCDEEEHYKVACTLHERRAAFRLAYENYVRKGLIGPNRFGLRVTPYHLLATTQLFISHEKNGRLTGTVTLIGDGKLGVPLDVTNPDEVNVLRRSGYRIAEISCLAIESRKNQACKPLTDFFGLTRLMAQHARYVGIDALVCAAVPSHVRFYEKFLGFQRLAEERPYPTVCNTRGIACWLDLTTVDICRPPMWKEYFAEPIPDSQLAAHPMPAWEVEQFREAAEAAWHHVPVHA